MIKGCGTFDASNLVSAFKDWEMAVIRPQEFNISCMGKSMNPDGSIVERKDETEGATYAPAV